MELDEYQSGMNPSVYQLPQYVSRDRRRARRAVLVEQRQRFALVPDSLDDDLPEHARRLPPRVARLPRDMDFPAVKKSRLVLGKLLTKVNGTLVSWMSLRSRTEGGQRRMFRLIRGPRHVRSRWRNDDEFARQRLCGVNPMHLQLCREPPAPELVTAADHWLAHREETARVADLVRHQRLFATNYDPLWHPSVQRHVNRKAQLAAPTCLFFISERGALEPLAIRLRPEAAEGPNPVLTPASPPIDWMLAKAHAQTADAHVHEGPYHLLETHLVNEAIALCMYRQLHPDHPLRQLLEDHYEGTLAINHTARNHLLSVTGPIQKAMAAGVPGVLNAARMHYGRWNFADNSLERQLARRGVGDIPRYYYRDDARAVHEAIFHCVSALLGLWYRRDRDVLEDVELQAWLAETAAPDGGDVPGFPARIATRRALIELVTELIFRAGPQHAAVNNGQFDSYGWIPNAPGTFYAPLCHDGHAGHDGHADDGAPDRADDARERISLATSEHRFWRAMPSTRQCIAQMSMVWVLSAPTERSLLHLGESSAFSAAQCFSAHRAVVAFRRRLQSISSAIHRRNERLDVPYWYLDPLNISRSTDI